MGRLETYTYPGGYKVGYEYFDNGALQKVTDVDDDNRPIWTKLDENARGQITDYSLGNGLSTHKDYDDYGFPTDIITSNKQHLEYTFDPVTGNLIQRKDNIYRLTEDFTYDNLLKSRLETWKVDQQISYSASYFHNGNIFNKSDVGDSFKSGGYAYTSLRPHAITEVNFPTAEYSQLATPNQVVTYTPFNNVSSITETEDDFSKSLGVTYGPDEERKITKYSEGRGMVQQLKMTKHFVFGNYEEEIAENGDVRKLHYISAADGLFAIYVKEEYATNTEFITFIHKDYLGSFDKITDQLGLVIEEFNFDPWGRRRNPSDWTFSSVPTSYMFDRGYTGHEHLDEFDLINMNARLYDPWVGRFLAPDPYVQAPTYSQNFNRYTYAYNNPLKYTDPSGKYAHFIIGAIAGGMTGLFAGLEAGATGWNLVGYIGIGAVVGAASAGIGSGFSSVMGGGTFGAGFMGASQAASVASSFGSGAALGGITGFTSGSALGFSYSLLNGQAFDKSLINGYKGGVIAGSIASVTGAIFAGFDAISEGEKRNFWTGKDQGSGRSPFAFNNTDEHHTYYLTSKGGFEKIDNIDRKGEQWIDAYDYRVDFGTGDPNAISDGSISRRDNYLLPGDNPLDFNVVKFKGRSTIYVRGATPEGCSVEISFDNRVIAYYRSGATNTSIVIPANVKNVSINYFGDPAALSIPSSPLRTTITGVKIGP